MATVQNMKATVRPKAGKGASRAARYSGRVPGVVYGDNQPPLMVLLDHDELKQRIYAGRFTTTLYELDVDGQKHRVIPRDYQLDVVKDKALHVDFLRVGKGTKLNVQVHVKFINEDASPGIKRGGVLNIVHHTLDLTVDADHIPEEIVVDLTGMDVGDSVHISSVKLPAGATDHSHEDDLTIATIVAPSGLKSEEAGEGAAEEAAAPAAENGDKKE